MCFPNTLSILLSRASRRLAALGFCLVILIAFRALPCRAQTGSAPRTVGKRWVEQPSRPMAHEPRLALVIGNTHYGGVHELKNPENDAKAIAETLKQLGFTTTVLLDASRDQMREEVYHFGDAITTAGPRAVALLYYSGHGAQVAGENYLVPIGFTMPAHAEDMGESAVSAQWVLDRMQKAHSQVSIAILDACRDNPFERSRSLAGKGLTEVTSAQGLYIAYATAAGSVADDNADGGNGLYTKALLRYLRTPGITVDQVFKKTRAAVYSASHGAQFPYVYDGLLNSDSFYLADFPLPPVADTDTHKQAMTRVNPKDGAEMILIPAGSFLMGDDDRQDNPRRTMRLPAYYIYKNLVTVGMYERFCRETGRVMPPAPKFDPTWSQKDNPIVNVRWEDAKAYCDWAGVTLPSETQWEKAARGTDGRTFPWGDTFDRSKLWCSKVTTYDAGGTAPVGSIASGMSPYGMLDVEGNVCQWCEDWYGPAQKMKALRGGGYDSVRADLFHAAYRSKDHPTAQYDVYGFRCASPDTH